MTTNTQPLPFGSPNMRLPDELRAPMRRHLADLRERYLELGWGARMGWGERPALIVIDLALWWTQVRPPMGSNVDSVVEATCEVLEAARAAEIPVLFTTTDYDPNDPPRVHDGKFTDACEPMQPEMLALDPRLQHREHEKIVRKKYASAFKGTALNEMLASLRVDTLVVTGVSTSHCIYATCRDATDSYRVIVPHEAVGERCEIMHEVNLLDIDIDLGDVMPVAEVVEKLNGIQRGKSSV